MADFFAPDKKAPKREAERLRTLAESLMQQGMPSGNEMVSGLIVKKSPIEGLTKALAMGAGGYFSGQAARAEDEAETARQQRVAELLSGALSGGGDQRLLNIAAIDPSLALKTYAEGLTPTSEMKNADWMGITPQQQRAMELNKGYAGTLKEGIAPRVDQFGNVMAAPVQMEGYGNVGSYQTAMAGQQAEAQEAAKSRYDMVDVPLPDGTRRMTREQALQMARQAGVDPQLGLGVFGAESNFGQNAGYSPAGAYGPMQVMPGTMADPGFGVTPAMDQSPQENMRVGMEYLKAMTDKYQGDQTLALMAYNWGPGNVDNWLASGADPAKIPQETKQYIQKAPQMGREALPGFAVQSGADQEASKQRAANLAAIDRSRLESLNENAQAIEGQLTTFNQIESLINQGTLGVTPTDRLAMAGHKIGIQSPETVNTSTLMKLGNQLVLSRGSLGAGVSVADAERYDKAAGDFSKAQSNEERLQYINTMREIAQKYSGQANSQIQQYRDTGMLPEYQAPVSPTGVNQSIDDEIAKLEAELGIR